MLCLMMPAIGFAVPASSFAAYLKKDPVRCGDRHFAGDGAVGCFVIARDELRYGSVQRCPPVRHRIRLHDERLRTGPGAIDDPAEDEPGDRGAVGILRDRNL